MKAKLLLSCVVLGNIVEVYGSGRKFDCGRDRFEERLRERHEMEIRDNRNKAAWLETDRNGYSAINQYQIEFLRELQSNQVLCIDVTKIQDRVEAALTIADKASEARSFLERYAAHIRSCDGDNANDIRKAEKSYAERNYEILQTVLLDPKKYGVLDIHIEYQEFSVPGSTTRYPRFCGFVIRK